MISTHSHGMIDTYVRNYLEHPDENAFHGLVELGKDCIPSVLRIFQKERTGGKISLMHIVQEIRGKEEQALLFDVAIDEVDVRVWSKAVEGLAYQGLSDLKDVLNHLVVETKSNPDKVEYITHMLHELE